MLTEYRPPSRPALAVVPPPTASPAPASGAVVSAAGLEKRILGMLEERIRRQERGELGDLLGLATGLPRLDRILNGLQTGLYVLAGAPSVGKTTFLVQLADHLGGSQGATVLLVTFENPPENLVLKSLARIGRRDALDLERGRVPLGELQRTWERYAPAAERLHLAEGGSHVTLPWLDEQVQRLQQEHGASCVVMVDYLQKMLVNMAGGTTKEKADVLAMGLRGLSRARSVPVLAVSSQSRQGYQGGGPRISTLATLKESGEIEYSADVVLHLRPPEPSEARNASGTGRARPVWLDVEKNRYGEKGEVALMFHPALASFYEEGAVEHGA